ncbi:CHRD domain-containing protein [Sphingomonas sp. SUN019]|uniref:CHRD domain-containing protein n=1 Tax=Sphingomonas sp. SUN019 TaxID=2937788 RepID=UPI002164A21E|nr:CHRD domain-containing protein [Sphingomonas sp. SUN019]UVO51541.1 CHRD domain-containing protein [Sphingomonas sp. SUN019]
MTTTRLATPALLLAAFATSSCATIAGTVGESFTTALVGAQEVPGPGDPQATGTAKVTADSATDTICADVRTQRLAPATMAHIHKGARGVAGAPVLTIDTPTGGRSNRCYSVDKALAAAILADPAGYYVNVHTAQFPKGAIRGQLR